MDCRSRKPRDLISKNIRGCHICIALIGFHKGSIVKHDQKKRSYTQIELDTARALGVRILPFILRDSEDNRNAWPAKFNNLEDSDVQAWRRECAAGITTDSFDATEIPDVLPAVTRQICKWEFSKRMRLQRGLVILSISILAVVTVFAAFDGSREWLLSRILAYHDPIVFQHSRDSKYNYARLFEGRSDIQDNSNMRMEIATARKSFEMFANTLGSFRQYEPDYAEAAARGVQLRFVVTDFSEANRSNWESFQNSTENTPENIVETRANAANIRKMIRELKKRFPSNVDYRLSRQPILYTTWVRDPDLPDGMAHVGVHFYGKTSQADWPAFRVSSKTGGNQLQMLKKQFETIWSEALPDQEDTLRRLTQ